ncbi:MAG: hypothetical protein JO255_22225 [Alphaproteobacteria bacterium]|nr:hypothetical protein [Alphaproteobacteria bacterium]
MKRRTGPETVGVAELEAGIARTRARLSHGLAVLDREYGLRHLLVRGTRLAQAAGERSSAAAEAVRREILPLALIGAGTLFLSLGPNGGAGLLQRLFAAVGHIQGLGKDLLALAAAAQPADAPPPDRPAQ